MKKLILALSLLLLLSNSGLGETKTDNKTDDKTKKTKKEELPPPPIPFSEVYVQEIPDVQVKEIEVQDLYEIPENVLFDFLKKRDKLNPYLRDYKNIKIRPYEVQILKKTNYFFYSPHILILFTFPEEIHRVIYSSVDQANILFEKNYLIALPPEPSTDVFSFVVVFKDYKAYYFFGERYTKNPSERSVILHYAYTYEEFFSPSNVVRAYYNKFKRCPDHNEIVKINNKYYQIQIQKQGVFTGKGEVYFCNRFYLVKEL